MKRFVLLLVLPVVLTGCLEQDPNPATYTRNTLKYRIVCLNGVKYYQVGGTGAVLAPYINSKTLQFENCDPLKAGY